MSATRAWSRFQIKNINDEAREFSGIASTPSLDLAGDVLDPEGCTYSLPLPVLFNHDAAQPIGNVIAATVTSEGIKIRAQIASVSEPASLKERLDSAWSMMKARLCQGLSVGFKVLEENRISTGYHIVRWKLLEVSCVVIPANSDCSITAIKRADRAASARGSSLPSTTRFAAPLDRSAIEALYVSDPRLRALRAQRIQRARAEARTPVAWRFAMLD